MSLFPRLPQINPTPAIAAIQIQAPPSAAPQPDFGGIGTKEVSSGSVSEGGIEGEGIVAGGGTVTGASVLTGSVSTTPL